MICVWFEISFNFKNFAQSSSEVNSLVRFELWTRWLYWNFLSKSAFAEWGFPVMRFNRNKSKLHSPSKSRMSDKLLTEIIRRTDGEQIVSVTLNQITSTRIHSRKQLGSCWQQHIQDVYPSKSRMVGKIIAQRGPARRIFKNTKKLSV